MIYSYNVKFIFVAVVLILSIAFKLLSKKDNYKLNGSWTLEKNRNITISFTDDNFNITLNNTNGVKIYNGDYKIEKVGSKTIIDMKSMFNNLNLYCTIEL